MPTLTLSEQYFLAWYRNLEPIEQLAVDDWLNTGDKLLIILLGLLSTDAHVLLMIAAPQSLNSFPFTRS